MLAILPLFAALSLAAAPDAGSPPPDPFATTRACTRLLTRFVGCASDRAFKKIVAGWIDADLGLTDRRVRDRLRAWAKPDGRRMQCAIWTGREGAAQHIGEGSQSAKLVDDGKASCQQLGRALDQSRWVPRAMVGD
jgi:hypothetical protein